MGAVCSLEATLLTRNVLKLVLYEPGMNADFHEGKSINIFGSP
jgi:hypothetical protein